MLFVITALSGILAAASAQSGKSFFVVGDFGTVTSMAIPDMVFD